MSEPTILCIGSFFKGNAFLRECKRQGCRVILITVEKLKDAAWARESIDEIFFMPKIVRPDITNAVSYLARERRIDRIIPLDDYDVETAAALREHLRIPGMGDTTARYFRDKLAMRVLAQESGIPVPPFVHVLNYDRLRAFMTDVPPPWMFKPRSEAGSIGLKKVENSEELWRSLDELGDLQSNYVLEKYLPGPVYHVDSIISEREVVFNIAHRYGRPPMDVYHTGGIFTTHTLAYDAAETQALFALNRQVLGALGMVRGVTHAEFIRSDQDGHFYFLETAARVGGANIDEMVAAAAGVNLWAEWARIELAHLAGEAYLLPPIRHEYAGLILCLARQDHPDLSAYNDAEIVWRLQNKENHAGLIVASPQMERVQELLRAYTERFANDFLAVLPPSTKAL
ncbi:MAG: ATP-grasp domain-containing protein [Chloroflexi bacterium]|nr:MAG: ATP-grasp domain-containing protein [Chloroflexota bacterium]